MLSCTFHAYAALKLAPILPQKSQEMQVVRTICSSTAKTSTVTLMFLHYFNNNNYFLFNGNSITSREGSCINHTLLRHRRQGETSS